MSAAVVIRAAAPDDVGHIARFIRDLAVYEKLEHELQLDEQALAGHLFGPTPCCGALIAETDAAPVGFALYFTSYSTFLTSPCMHLEDLYVDPGQRGKGVGLALLRAVAAVAVERGCKRLDWSVLDWNTPAIGFYERQGATVLPDWRVCRVAGDALVAMAAGRG
ncbi:MAG: GNAT family N-acetyltransferase [Planctomycetota bacterium]